MQWTTETVYLELLFQNAGWWFQLHENEIIVLPKKQSTRTR